MKRGFKMINNKLKLSDKEKELVFDKSIKINSYKFRKKLKLLNDKNKIILNDYIDSFSTST